MTTNESEPVSPPQPTEVVARAATYYRMTRYFMVLMIFGYGIYSIIDGFYRYPRDMAAAKAAGQTVMPHADLDIPFNQFFGIVLPPLSIVMLIFCLRKSRGEIRFDGKVLIAPGHPPVSLENITALDQRLWDRKGIAYIDYDLGSDQKGRITLDDFIYDRNPIDEIHKRITQYLAPPEEPATSAETKSPGI